ANEGRGGCGGRVDLERRLLGTVLESVTTGVLAFDSEGRVLVCNPAARSLLSLDGDVALESLRRRADLAPIAALLEEAPNPPLDPPSREIHVMSETGERR